MESYEIRGRVTDVGSSCIQAVFHQLFHGRAEVQHNLPRADAIDRDAVDRPDGPGGLRARDRGTANHGIRAGSKFRLGFPRRAGRGSGNQGKQEPRRRSGYGPREEHGSREESKAAWAEGGKARARTGSVHTLTRARPPPSGPRRGGTRRALLRLPPRSVSAGKGRSAPGPAAQPRPPSCGDALSDSTLANGRRAGWRTRSSLGTPRVGKAPLRQWARGWAGRRRRSGRRTGRGWAAAAMPAMYAVRPLHSAGVLAEHLPTCMYPLPNLHRAPGSAAPPQQVGARGGRKDLLGLRPAVLALARSGMRPPGRCSLRREPQRL